jgi:hypothetical protein
MICFWRQAREHFHEVCGWMGAPFLAERRALEETRDPRAEVVT